MAARQDVAPLAALDPVVAPGALDVVSAFAALEYVRSRVADEPVVEVRADQVLNAREPVALRISPARFQDVPIEFRHPAQLHGDCPGRTRVARGIDPLPAVEDVCPGSTSKGVVPAQAPEDVVPAQAPEDIRIVRTQKSVGCGRSDPVCHCVFLAVSVNDNANPHRADVASVRRGLRIVWVCAFPLVNPLHSIA